jgi:hypothetical protein
MNPIEWTSLEHREERLVWWKLDSYREQEGWVDGKLEFLIRVWESGKTRLFRDGCPDPIHLGTFKTVEIARRWAEEVELQEPAWYGKKSNAVAHQPSR